MSLPVKPPRGSPNKSKKRSQDDLGNERRQEEHRQHTVPEISHVELEQESKERSQKVSCPEGCQQQSFAIILREHVYQGLQPAWLRSKAMLGSRSQERSWEKVGVRFYQ